MSGVKRLYILLVFDTEEDRAKFEWLYETYKHLMLHKAHGILHDHMLAEDAVSEAFLRIYKNISKIEDPASKRSLAFVMTIVKNVALTMLESKKKHAADEFDDAYASDMDVEALVVADLSQETIYALVNDLNEEYKSVFLLKYAYDMTHREIGKLLAISENNVTVRLHRAKKRLSALLVEKGYAHEAEH